MRKMIVILIFICVCCDVAFSSSDLYDVSGLGYNPATPDQCVEGKVPKGRVPWILHVRQPDHGWKEHTHRANIAIAVYNWKGTDSEMRQMELQLEVEITKALLRNATEKIHENDLALFIHALIATKKNPRDFHGIDLVADLLHRTSALTGDPLHPFLVLTLCNSYAVEHKHLLRIKKYTDEHENKVESTEQTELKALALKAFACAANISKIVDDPSLAKFAAYMTKSVKCLVEKQQNDGSFGNAYTTSLIVQALIAANNNQHFWNKTEAMRYLEVEAEIKVNLVKAYYIEMALNARNVTYIKDLYNGRITGPTDPGVSSNFYVQYTVKDDTYPEKYHSITLKVSSGTNFFDIMNTCAEESAKFRFTHYLNEENKPMIYSVSGIPNDAEANMFWIICRQNGVEHQTHTSNITSFNDSPAKLMPHENEHITFWYRDSECPKK